MKIGNKMTEKIKIYVWPETFAVVKSKRAVPDAFAVVQDRNEITVIIDQTRIDDEDIIEIEKDWKLITFDTVLPFDTVGFLAAITNALAEEGISVFVISSYSTDHILVKKENLEKALEKLESMGFEVG